MIHCGKTMLLKLVLIGWCATAIPGTALPVDEADVIVATLRLLRIGNCILLSDRHGQTGTYLFRKLNENFILTGSVTNETLQAYLRESKPPDSGTAVVMKVATTSAIETLLTENSKRLFWFVWFLIAAGDLDDGIRIPFNCQFFHVKTGVGRNHRLMEIYHLKNSSTFKKEFGWWSPGRGLMARSANMHDRRKDFEGVELEITLCNKYQTESVIQTFWMDTARMLNFSLKMELQRLNKTANGYVLLQDPDGSTCVWGITGLDFDRDWIFLDFGIIVKLVMKFRSSNDVGWRAYIRPFKTEMWKAIGVWLVLSTSAIVVVTGCTKRTLYLNVFTSFFCLCNSDPTAVHPSNEPITPTTKLVYLMTLIVPAVIVPAYSAYILSTLSIVLPLDTFSDLKGFIADGTYRVTAVDNTFAIRYLQGSTDPQMKYVYEHLFVGVDNAAPSYLVMTQQLCKDNKLAGLYPFTPELHSFQCRMFIMPQELITISTGTLLPKGSPLRKLFNERFSEYHERGLFLIKEDHHHGEDDGGDAFGEETHSLTSLNMSQMAAIFLLPPLGVVLSLLVLALELAVKRRTDNLNIEPHQTW